MPIYLNLCFVISILSYINIIKFFNSLKNSNGSIIKLFNSINNSNGQVCRGRFFFFFLPYFYFFALLEETLKESLLAKFDLYGRLAGRLEVLWKTPKLTLRVTL